MNYVLYEISLCQKCSKIALKCGLTHNVVKCCFLYERNKGGSIMKRISIVSFPPQKYLNFLFEIITLLSYNFGYWYCQIGIFTYLKSIFCPCLSARFIWWTSTLLLTAVFIRIINEKVIYRALENNCKQKKYIYLIFLLFRIIILPWYMKKTTLTTTTKTAAINILTLEWLL